VRREDDDLSVDLSCEVFDDITYNERHALWFQLCCSQSLVPYACCAKCSIKVLYDFAFSNAVSLNRQTKTLSASPTPKIHLAPLGLIATFPMIGPLSLKLWGYSTPFIDFHTLGNSFAMSGQGTSEGFFRFLSVFRLVSSVFVFFRGPKPSSDDCGSSGGVGPGNANLIADTPLDIVSTIC